ncbi:MAG TPA: OsmC family protein [Acidothermaceae bacterium]|nr:OsmC family protein [Acidothermaceae bacterium]
MTGDYAVSVAAGSLRSGLRADAEFPHRWTTEGVAVETAFTGAHLFHLAAAACVLNDIYREAAKSGVELVGVRVDADGGFDAETWQSTGVTYRVQLDSTAPNDKLDELLRLVDEVAEIPRAMRATARVERGA